MSHVRMVKAEAGLEAGIAPWLEQADSVEDAAEVDKFIEPKYQRCSAMHSFVRQEREK